MQYNACQTTNGIFHRIRALNFTICMVIQKNESNQSNIKKEKKKKSEKSGSLISDYIIELAKKFTM